MRIRNTSPFLSKAGLLKSMPALIPMLHTHDLKSRYSNFNTPLDPDDGVPDGFFSDDNVGRPVLVADEISKNDASDDNDVGVPMQDIPDFAAAEIIPSDIQENITSNDIANDASNGVPDEIPGHRSQRIMCNWTIVYNHSKIISLRTLCRFLSRCLASNQRIQAWTRRESNPNLLGFK